MKKKTMALALALTLMSNVSALALTTKEQPEQPIEKEIVTVLTTTSSSDENFPW